ncbi:MAG: cobalamin-binding protein [Anaerolineae bacterium]|nr:cobalamin-binding protein [Anaerolineae bacterium]
MKKVLLAPLDPVHDNAVKLLKRKLSEAGYDAIAMRPGTTSEEVIEKALEERPIAILVSRTLGYKVAETLGRLVDLAEASGLREMTRLGVGGMAITKETGGELGFDACFTGELNMTEVLAFLEGKPVGLQTAGNAVAERQKPNIVQGFTYAFKDKEIETLLDGIVDQILEWVKGKTSPGIERAKLRAEMLAEGISLRSPAKVSLTQQRLREQYLALCDDTIRAFYLTDKLPAGVRWLAAAEIEAMENLLGSAKARYSPLRHVGEKPLFFSQYGTGCPVMDVMHIKVAEAWGVDGVLHFDPSWGAQCEGLLEGYLSHEHDGTILTLENLKFIRHAQEPATLWNVRGHRGLNTPETQVLGHAAGADLFKINIPYGSTAGGTDPQRLTVDGVYSLRLAAEYGIPFDIPGNDELSGVPPFKTFAGILIMVALGLKLGAKPIPKPLLCYSPYMTIYGRMDDNMIDMNIAKLMVWREIVDAPVWPGEPVGFMTHSPERVQSSMMTAVHAALASSMGVDAVTIASSDEAYSKGPISAAARVDTLRAVRDALRFQGSVQLTPTPRALTLADEIHDGICEVLKTVAERGDFVASICEGLLGNEEDGLYPGRIGAGTVSGGRL